MGFKLAVSLILLVSAKAGWYIFRKIIRIKYLLLKNSISANLFFQKEIDFLPQTQISNH